MKRSASVLVLAALVLCLSISLTSCQAIADIFKAGMGFGIFLVIVVVGGIFALIMRGGRK